MKTFKAFLNESEESEYEFTYRSGPNATSKYHTVSANSAKHAISKFKVPKNHIVDGLYSEKHGSYHNPQTGKKYIDQFTESTPAWQRSAGKDPEGGLNRKGIASYRREHPGSKLSMAVTTKPSKLKPDSKAANRRKSFCSRMKGMKAKLTSAKTAHDPDSRINKSLRKWNC